MRFFRVWTIDALKAALLPSVIVDCAGASSGQEAVAGRSGLHFPGNQSARGAGERGKDVLGAGDKAAVTASLDELDDRTDFRAHAAAVELILGVQAFRLGEGDAVEPALGWFAEIDG